ELADRAWKARSVSRAKRIAVRDVFEARHKYCEAKRVEPRIVEGKVVCQRRQGLVLIRSHTANFVENGLPQRHDHPPLELSPNVFYSSTGAPHKARPSEADEAGLRRRARSRGEAGRR